MLFLTSFEVVFQELIIFWISIFAVFFLVLLLFKIKGLPIDIEFDFYFFVFVTTTIISFQLFLTFLNGSFLLIYLLKSNTFFVLLNWIVFGYIFFDLILVVIDIFDTNKYIFFYFFNLFVTFIFILFINGVLFIFIFFLFLYFLLTFSLFWFFLLLI